MDISKIRLEGQEPLNIKDEVARETSQVNTKNIDILKNRKYMFFGDSYGSGEIGSSWITNIVNILDLKEGDFYNCARNGTGFTFPAHETWEIVLDYFIKEIQNKDEITDIICCGGYNDGVSNLYSTQESIEFAISNFVKKAKANFPNATVRVGHICWSADCTKWENLRKSIKAYQNCNKYGAVYLTNVEYSMHNYTLYLPDYFHPNEEGNKNNARHIINAILNGSADVFYEVPVELVKIENNDISFSDISVISTTHNNISTLEFRGINTNQMLLQGSGTNTLINSNTLNALYNLKDFKTCFAGQNLYHSNTVNMNVFITDTSSTNHVIPAILYVENYKVSLGSLAQTPFTIKFLGLPTFTLTSDSLYC